MSSLYFAVNDRRRGRSERGLIAPFSTGVSGRSAAARVNVIKPVLALCGREEVLPEVSHVSLTHRDELARLRARVSELEATERTLATERDILRAAVKSFAGETTW
jgi:hypothetical protein